MSINRVVFVEKTVGTLVQPYCFISAILTDSIFYDFHVYMGIHQFGHNVSTEVQNFILKKYAAKYLRHIEKLQTWLD